MDILKNKINVILEGLNGVETNVIIIGTTIDEIIFSYLVNGVTSSLNFSDDTTDDAIIEIIQIGEIVKIKICRQCVDNINHTHVCDIIEFILCVDCCIKWMC